MLHTMNIAASALRCVGGVRRRAGGSWRRFRVLDSDGLRNQTQRAGFDRRPRVLGPGVEAPMSTGDGECDCRAWVNDDQVEGSRVM
jgi:hypothetical protein